MTQNRQNKTVAENRRARHEFHILETFEAGMELRGTEVKSLRNGKANIQDAFAMVEEGQIFVHNMHISPYEMGNRFNHDPKRKRRLLLHKAEIARLYGKAREKGLTLVVLRIYFSGSYAKLELALAQGKKLHDKREAAAEKESRREMERAFKERSQAF